MEMAFQNAGGGERIALGTETKKSPDPRELLKLCAAEILNCGVLKLLCRLIVWTLMHTIQALYAYRESKMTSWHPRILKSSRSKYLGIVEALEQDILEGRVKPGTLLPSQRAIARDLSVDLTTVTRAFAEARQRGLIRARAGRGTFALWPPDAPQVFPQSTNTYVKRKVTLDLGMNNPPVGRTHAFAATLRRDLDRLLAEDPSVLDYPTEVGRDLDMQAGVNWLKQRIDGVQR